MRAQLNAAVCKFSHPKIANTQLDYFKYYLYWFMLCSSTCMLVDLNTFLLQDLWCLHYVLCIYFYRVVVNGNRLRRKLSIIWCRYIPPPPPSSSCCCIVNDAEFFPVPIPGVPMPHAVAGVACGLFTRIKPDSQDIDQYQILSDINVRPPFYIIYTGSTIHQY